MNEELMTNNEEMNTEIETTELEVYDEPETSSGNGLKLALGLGALAAAGVAAWCCKNKAKIEERKIEKLRKKGYVIYKAEDDIEEDVVDEEFEEDNFEDDMK